MTLVNPADRSDSPEVKKALPSPSGCEWETGCLPAGGDGVNKLYFGDNLVVLREHIKDESVDLIYLDPPFNSDANYNVLFRTPAGGEGTTPKERKALAKKDAAARWSGDIKQATHGSDDHPLTIGDIAIPCYVLEDETRVLSQRGVIGGLGMSTGGSGLSVRGADRLTIFLGGGNRFLPTFPASCWR